MILLDTNIVISAINDRPHTTVHRIGEAERNGIGLMIPSIVMFELLYGIAKSARKVENSHRLARFLAGPVKVLPFDHVDGEFAGQVRLDLEAAGTPIGPYDTLIAGQALRHGATLATANVREFGRVKGLTVEDWSK